MDKIRISGKTVSLPSDTSSHLGRQWKFETRPGGWVIARSESGERVRLMVHQSRGKGQETWSASIHGRLWEGERVVQISGSRSHSAGGPEMNAQFPGKVRKILVEKGALVQEGDTLVLMEAMKMEFAIRAPFSGRITQVLVVEQQQVSQGDRLVEMETE